jgi:hypothetical protein
MQKRKKDNYSDGWRSHVHHKYGIMSPSSFIFMKDQNKKSLYKCVCMCVSQNLLLIFETHLILQVCDYVYVMIYRPNPFRPVL